MDEIAACSNCNLRSKKHKCCKQGIDGACELSTITASQISSATVFIVFLLFNIFSLLPTNIVDANSAEAIIRWEIFILYFIALVYYFFGSWEAEEGLIDELRQLHPIAFYLQWGLRICILMVFGLYSNIISIIDDFFGLFHLDNDRAQFLASIIYLAFIFLLFALWDIIVFLGGQKNIALQFFKYDIGGAILIGGFATSYFLHTWIFLIIFTIGLIILAIFLSRLIYQLNPIKSLARVKLINQIR